MSNEPSMEEILSSIKRIIAEEDRATPAPRAPRRSASPRPDEIAPIAGAETDDQILELTEIVPGDVRPDAPALQMDASQPQIIKPDVARAAPRAEPKPESRMESKAPRTEPKPEARPARPREAPASRAASEDLSPAAVLSDLSAKAARESLDHLSRLLVRNDDGQSNTLEGLVREMLRPMLKDWLDANLPTLVEALVKREIDRITGRV